MCSRDKQGLLDGALLFTFLLLYLFAFSFVLLLPLTRSLFSSLLSERMKHQVQTYYGKVEETKSMAM